MKPLLPPAHADVMTDSRRGRRTTPPTATSWRVPFEHIRRLHAELAAAVEVLAETEAAVQTERRRHLATQRKLDPATADLDGHRASDERRAEELAARDELNALRTDNSRLRAQLTLAAKRAQPAGPNRAKQRQAAKRDRRTER